MGTFIDVEIRQPLSENLIRLCPVEIFTLEDGAVVVNPANEDECTLCELCLHAAPSGAIHIHKKYKDETLVSDGSAL
ncbi:MAG: hypothetical protein ACLFTK_13900 [Anaerolineales bacterium]